MPSSPPSESPAAAERDQGYVGGGEQRQDGQGTEGNLPREAESQNVLSHSTPIYNWKDVTEQFSAATKQLNLGELLHDDMFGLFEAMSAIEMMDPKMDAGMRCNRNKSERPLTSFRAAADSGHLKVDGVTRTELLGVMDDTLCCLVTWLEGHSLAQTVFTNLYLHSPFEIEHPGMKAFSVVVLKLIEVIKDVISRGGVYEEEDFQPVSYHFKLGCEVSDARAAGMLREVEEELQRTARANRPKDGDDRSAEVVKEHEETSALYARFRFLRHLYQSLLALNKGDAAECRKALTGAREQTQAFADTVEMGNRPAEGKNQMGFDRLANQRLLPPTFPRYTEIKSRKETAEYFRCLVERLLSATAVASLNNGLGVHAAIDFFADFSAGNPCVLSRSALQILYAPLVGAVKAVKAGYATAQKGVCINAVASSSSGSAGDRGAVAGSIQFTDLLRETAKAFIAPPALSIKTPPFNSQQVKECIDNFLRQCSLPISLLLQSFGHNRARQRDKFAAVLDEFAAVQEEAEKLDDMLNAILGVAAAAAASDPASAAATAKTNNMYFSTWLLYHVLRVMVRHVRSGFELELYSAHEYPYLYWYLYELLYPWLISCLQRADAFVAQREHAVEAQQKNAGKNKKKVKGGSGKKNKNSIRPYAREMTLYQGYCTLCSAYFKLMTALKKEKKIVIPAATFDSEAVRYEHRFAAFSNLLTPPLMPYSQFLEVYEFNASTDSKDLFSSAAKEFTRARQIFESVLAAAPKPQSTSSSEIESLISVGKVNFVASVVLARDSQGRKVELDFAQHSRTFPTVRIV